MQRRRDLYLTRYECRRCGTIIYEFRPPIQFSRCGNCPRRLRILSTDGYVPRTGMEQFGTSESSKHLLKLISISLIFSKFICRTLNGAENSKSMNEAQTFTPFKNTQKHWGQCIGSLKSFLTVVKEEESSSWLNALSMVWKFYNSNFYEPQVFIQPSFAILTIIKWISEIIEIVWFHSSCLHVYEIKFKQRYYALTSETTRYLNFCLVFLSKILAFWK